VGGLPTTSLYARLPTSDILKNKKRDYATKGMHSLVILISQCQEPQEAKKSSSNASKSRYATFLLHFHSHVPLKTIVLREDH